MSGSDFLTAADLSALIGIAPITLSQWRARGKGPAFMRLGRSVRYARADVTAWIALSTIGKVQP